MLKLRAIFSRKVGKKKSAEDEVTDVESKPAAWGAAGGGGRRSDLLHLLDLSQIKNVIEESSSSENQSLLPCGFCGRTFTGEVLARHSLACERAVAAAARRRTFDSSKQRREGTDMEQFPTSPTSASSKSKTPLLKKKVANPKTLGSAAQSAGGAGLASVQGAPGGGACPHCERVFNQRALDRHVDWCSNRTQRPAQRDVAGEVALQRLHARTRYKPPTPQAMRSHRFVQQVRQQATAQRVPQQEYDPYKSAAAQMKRLMASQLDLSAPSFASSVPPPAAPLPVLSMLSAPTRCRSVPRAPTNQVDAFEMKRGSQKSSTLLSGEAAKGRHGGKSPRAERRGGNMSSHNTLRRTEKGAGRTAIASSAAGDRANKLSDKYMKKPDVFNLELFLSEGTDYIDPRLINRRDNLPVDIDADILRSSDSLLSNENLPKEFDSFTITKNQINKNRNMKESNERKSKSSSIDSLSRQYDVIMHSLESSISNKLNRLNGDVNLEDLISDFDRELAACGGGGGGEGGADLYPCAAVDSDGNHPSGETDEERTAVSKASQDSAYNSLRRSRRGEGEGGGALRAPRGTRTPRRRPSVDSSTPSSTESGVVCAVEGGAGGAGGAGSGATSGRPARFCHECGCGFPPPPANAHFCASCGAKRLILAVS